MSIWISLFSYLLVILVSCTVLYSLFQTEVFMRTKIINSNIGNILLSIIEIFILFMLYYSLIFIFESNVLLLKCLIIGFITFMNFYAIILSYHYFFQTKCTNNEGNILAKFMYNQVGIKFGHKILIVIRILLNLIIGILLFNNNVNILQSTILYSSIVYYDIWGIYCVLASIYSFEFITNLLSVRELEKNPYTCDYISTLCHETQIPNSNYSTINNLLIKTCQNEEESNSIYNRLIDFKSQDHV